MSILIRKLVPEDMENGFFETLEHLSPIGEMNKDKAKTILKNILTNPSYVLFIAESDGKIVGTVTLLIEQKLFRSFGKVAHLENLSTKKGFEGKGIGSQLIQKVAEEAKKQGCYKIILDCNEKLASFYERFGFKRNEIGMRLDLR